jgi:hypothetical protein
MPQSFGPYGLQSGFQGLSAPQQQRLPSEKPQTRRAFTPEEDQVLADAVGDNQFPPWTEIAVKLPGRNGRQCRGRWMVLNPDRSKDPWTEKEDSQLTQLFLDRGAKWVDIAKSLGTGRSAQDCKNRWNYRLKTRLTDPPDKRSTYGQITADIVKFPPHQLPRSLTPSDDVGDPLEQLDYGGLSAIYDDDWPDFYGYLC